MSNRLAEQSSPYLLQHAENPVDWYPWGEEALARAKAEQKPIFLSIGYSACHWCHVMEHESFENESIAAQLNEHFVCVKVDREERPELDRIYMTAVQILSGGGGWPMSVFLTPDQKPIFGGTYWPPTAKMGMPGFDQIIAAVVNAWTNRRRESIEQAEKLTAGIQEFISQLPVAETPAGEQTFSDAAAKLASSFDSTHGGFGKAPKFPHASALAALLRVWYRNRRDSVLDMVRLALDKMAAGGIYDHLGGGFARYSVDVRWLVPHFEKMLYDNAQLASLYINAFRATGDINYARIARETCDYVLRDMTDAAGGFHSTEDADSEGEEGKFYVWTPEEIMAELGAELGERFCYVYDVSEGGNFEGKNILHLPKSIEQCASIKGWEPEQLEQQLANARARLWEARNRRLRPGKDDKVIVSWNGLMIEALARAGCVLHEPRYLEAACRAARFVLTDIRASDGRLFHVWRQGQARHPAFLDDYACLLDGLVSLYEATSDETWIDEAMQLVNIVQQHFRDPDGASYFYTPDDHEPLIARHKDVHDSAVPSGNAKLATALLRLGKLCGRADFVSQARDIVASCAGLIEQLPQAASQMMVALDIELGPFYELVVVGDDRSQIETILNSFWQRYIPNFVLAVRSHADRADGSIHLNPIFVGREAHPDSALIYVCQKFTCAAPVHASGADALFDSLSGGTV